MILHLPRVVAQLQLAPALVVGLGRFEVGGQRHLGVDDDVLSAWQLDDGVGRQPAFFGLDRLLELVVAALDDPRVLEDAAQLELAPLAADVR